MPTMPPRFRWLEIPTRSSAFDSDPKKAFAAQALHSLLLITLLFGVFNLGVGVPFFAVRRAVAAAIWAAVVAAALACLFLLRRGYVRPSSWIFVSSSWLLLAVVMVLSGGIRSPAAFSHLAVLVMAVWLLGQRAAIWIAGLSLAFGLVLAILESGGIELPRYFPIPAINAWGLALGLVCLTILPLSSVNQALAEFAEQAHQELAARRREEHARFEADSRFRATSTMLARGI